MQLLATASSSTQVGPWAYLVLFLAAAAGYLGIPLIGTAVITAAAVMASQGELNIVAVLIVAAIGCEIGGLGGYGIGQRWGREFLERPGLAQAWRIKTVTKGEQLYQKWGRAAVFLTPSPVSGVLAMKFSQFVVWNFLAGTVFVVAVGAGAYGVSALASGNSDAAQIGMLVGGIAVAALSLMLAWRSHHRHQAARSAEDAAAKPTDSAVQQSR